MAFDNDLYKLSNLLLEKYPDKFTNKKIIYDGEVDGGKSGSFQKLMTQVRKLGGVDPQRFKFHIFDLVLEDITFLERYQM